MTGFAGSARVPLSHCPRSSSGEGGDCPPASYPVVAAPFVRHGRRMRDSDHPGPTTDVDIAALIESEALVAEQAEATSDPDEPLPPHVKVTRGRTEGE